MVYGSRNCCLSSKNGSYVTMMFIYKRTKGRNWKILRWDLAAAFHLLFFIHHCFKISLIQATPYEFKPEPLLTRGNCLYISCFQWQCHEPIVSFIHMLDCMKPSKARILTVQSYYLWSASDSRARQRFKSNITHDILTFILENEDQLTRAGRQFITLTPQNKRRHSWDVWFLRNASLWTEESDDTDSL